MRSWQSILFERLLQVRGTKKKFLDVDLMNTFIASKYHEAPYELDLKFQQKYNIKKAEMDHMRYYVINEQPSPKKIIYYFHGGAYINEPLIFHWRYLVKLAEKTDFMIIVPLYPKLPRFTHEESLALVHELYDDLLKKYEVPFIFMGDSAGGGLALAYAQDVKMLDKKQCEQIILHSPWLDVTGENPAYEELQKVDPMLGLAGAQVLGKLWAGTQDPKHYKISPLHGDLRDIGRITLFVGTSEMLLVDARMLLEKADEQGIEILYFEYPKMNHVFPVFPIPEAEKALKTLLPILMK